MAPPRFRENGCGGVYRGNVTVARTWVHFPADPSQKLGRLSKLVNPPRNAACGHRLQGVSELCGIVGIRILATPTDPVLFPVLWHPGLYDGKLRGRATVQLVNCMKQFMKFDVEEPLLDVVNWSGYPSPVRLSSMRRADERSCSYRLRVIRPTASMCFQPNPVPAALIPPRMLPRARRPRLDSPVDLSTRSPLSPLAAYSIYQAC